jgi:hypothetical protein
LNELTELPRIFNVAGFIVEIVTPLDLKIAYVFLLYQALMKTE